MCERCERNTQIKRQLSDVLYRAPSIDDVAAQALPGFTQFLDLARQLEHLSRVSDGTELDGPEAERFRVAVRELGADGRTDVIRIAQYLLSMAQGIRQDVAMAKMELNDSDGTMFTVTLEDGALVVRVNGKETSRTPLEPGQDPDASLDAAERAMRAHRDLHGAL